MLFLNQPTYAQHRSRPCRGHRRHRQAAGSANRGCPVLHHVPGTGHSRAEDRRLQSAGDRQGLRREPLPGTAGTVQDHERALSHHQQGESGVRQEDARPVAGIAGRTGVRADWLIVHRRALKGVTLGKGAFSEEGFPFPKTVSTAFLPSFLPSFSFQGCAYCEALCFHGGDRLWNGYLSEDKSRGISLKRLCGDFPASLGRSDSLRPFCALEKCAGGSAHYPQKYSGA